MVRMNLIQYMNHHWFDCHTMSMIILILNSTGGSIVAIVDNPERKVL